MAATQLEAPRAEGAAHIRNEPVQARSAARLTALLDAAAQVIEEIGYERLTTAMVAERAGASIGTVYRYFPDRIAVLQSLAARNAERTTDAALAELSDPVHADWAAALSAAFGLLVDAFRSEPGFASLRYGDVLDLRPAIGAPALRDFADRMFEVLTKRFALDRGDAARNALDASVVMADSVAARAFHTDPRGDEKTLAHAATAAFALLAPFWGDPRRS